MDLKDNEKKYHQILDSYLNQSEKEEVHKIIYSFFMHDEFQRRMQKPFLHHSDISLGEHILEDTMVTYLLAKRKKDICAHLALKISMMHDLYQLPWQNNSDALVKHFANKHGFRHPIEAVINALYWYPEAFKDDDDAKIIIDGIIHHMYPLPVRRIKKFEDLELKNMELLKKIDTKYLQMIIDSTNRGRLGNFSMVKSLFSEGRIMSKADKKVSIGQIKNFSSAKALLTGKNKTIK